ncbi:RWD domain-containing protein 1 isoform X1 [Vanacampus margaritifer]
MEIGMEALYTFLRSRNIPEENIIKLRDDKIDVSVIELMDDRALAVYIPAYGDRIAARKFCSEYQRKGASTQTKIVSDLTKNQLTNADIKLNRTNLLDELISQFIDPNLLNRTFTFGYINERGAEAPAVSRDVYSAFWMDFYDYATEGQDMRVPILSHKRMEAEWKAIGRILLKGFQDHGYFPCMLAKAFTAALLFGEKSVTPDLLFESFLSYISKEERDLVNKAIEEDLDYEEEEEMIDFLGRMGVKCIPVKENLKATLFSVAHKMIIQKPKYALDKMSEVVGPKLRQVFDNVDRLQQLYDI